MANSKSAEKRIKVNKRNQLQNKYYKTSVKTLTKSFFTTLEFYKDSQKVQESKKVEEILNSIYSLIDKGGKKNIFHKNTVARKKAKLAKAFKSF